MKTHLFFIGPCIRRVPVHVHPTFLPFEASFSLSNLCGCMRTQKVANCDEIGFPSLSIILRERVI